LLGYLAMAPGGIDKTSASAMYPSTTPSLSTLLGTVRSIHRSTERPHARADTCTISQLFLDQPHAVPCPCRTSASPDKSLVYHCVTYPHYSMCVVVDVSVRVCVHAWVRVSISGITPLQPFCYCNCFYSSNVYFHIIYSTVVWPWQGVTPHFIHLYSIYSKCLFPIFILYP
jgi:hypothetical protein